MSAWVEVPASAGDDTVTILMDVDDFVALDGRKLSIGSHGYAQMWNRPGVLLLHRWIMGIPTGMRYRILVDHKNHDVYDCRKENLRLLEPTASNLNRTVAVRDLPRGVYRARSGRFVARLRRHRKYLYLGTFDLMEDAEREAVEAASVYDQAHGLSGLAPVMEGGF
jgi:hypothetical protein